MIKSVFMPKPPLTADDIYNFRWIDHARLTRRGDRVAYVVRWADRDAVEYRSRVFVRGLGVEDMPLQATGGPKVDGSPEWDPSGRRIAFISRKGAANQLFVLDSGTGDARQLTSLRFGVSSPSWSPDGSQIAFLGTVIGHPEGVVEDPRPPEGGPDAPPRTPVARVAQGIDFRHDLRGYLDGRRSHLFVVDAGGGEPRQLTDGRWSVEGFDWSPDGSRLVLSGNPRPDNDLELTRSLYVLPAVGGELREIASGLVLSSGPSWSPRGDLIAFAALAQVDVGRYDRIWVVGAEGGDARCLTAGHDLCAGDHLITDMRAGHGVRLRWNEAGTRILFLATQAGTSAIYSIAADGSDLREEIGGAREIFDFDCEAGAIAYLASDSTGPGDLYAGDRRLTNLNPWLAEREVCLPERMEFKAADGLAIEGWLIKPPAFDGSRKWPLVMEIHGGPHGAYTSSFFHEFQMLAGAGFLVFFVNPRGSCGYGEDFMHAVVRDWGGKDFGDLMTALDQLIERTGFVDSARMGVGGGSYGGFMTNWIVGQNDRFAAAVSMRSISDLVTFRGNTDIPIWGEVQWGPEPWSDPEFRWSRSPLRYVENVKTPLLLTHGEMDLRCPIDQAEAFFGALRLLRKEVEMVRFPEESHDLSRSGRPDRRIERLRRIQGWFARHLLASALEREEQAAHV